MTEISLADKLRFERICSEMLSADRERDSIGMYQEKRLHATLKRYFCPDTERHEQKIGAYTADILSDGVIYEIQTGSFLPLKKKIAYYLENTDLRINIVCPLAHKKWVSWLDPETGDISARRRSPKSQKARDALPEIYRISELMPNERLCVTVMLLEIEEYRLLCGWDKSRKRGSCRYERIPISIIGQESFCLPSDLETFLPPSDSFTAAEFSSFVGIKGRKAYHALYALQNIGLICETNEKRGRARVFCKTYKE